METIAILTKIMIKTVPYNSDRDFNSTKVHYCENFT